MSFIWINFQRGDDPALALIKRKANRSGRAPMKYIQIKTLKLLVRFLQ